MYKNIRCSIEFDMDYIENAHAYWLVYDKEYNEFIDFVDNLLINKMDLKILAHTTKLDPNIVNGQKFVDSLKEDYLIKVKSFCMGWDLQLTKVL